jgi:hypothetical protein
MKSSIFSSKFFTSLLTMAVVTPVALAQIGAPDIPPGLPQYKSEAKLFTIFVVPKDKTAKIFFAGKEAAKIDFEKDHKVLEITAFQKGRSETLAFDKNGDTYIISNLPSWKEPYELQIKSETRGELEQTKIKIHKP